MVGAWTLWVRAEGLARVGATVVPGSAFQSGLACLGHGLREEAAGPVPGLPIHSRSLFQPPRARSDSRRSGPVTAHRLVASFLVWGARFCLSFCPLECQLAHVSSQLPHAHSLRVSLDVRDRVPTACPVTGDEVRVGGLDLHHACCIALQAWFSFFFLLASLQIFHC